MQTIGQISPPPPPPQTAAMEGRLEVRSGVPRPRREGGGSMQPAHKHDVLQPHIKHLRAPGKLQRCVCVCGVCACRYVRACGRVSE